MYGLLLIGSRSHNSSCWKSKMHSVETQRLSEEMIIASKAPRKVSFNSVSVREYDVTFHRSHPAVKKGPALSLDWTYTSNASRPVDDYESERCGRRRSSKSGLLKLDHCERRRKLVLDFGFSNEELRIASRRRIPVTRSRSAPAVVSGRRRWTSTQWRCTEHAPETTPSFNPECGFEQQDLHEPQHLRLPCHPVTPNRVSIVRTM